MHHLIALLVRTIIRLLPIAFVPLLVPPGSSATKTMLDEGDLAETGEAKGAGKPDAGAVERAARETEMGTTARGGV